MTFGDLEQLFSLLEPEEVKEPENLCVVRLTTSCWKDSRGALHYERKIAPLVRKSRGYQTLFEDAADVSVKDAIICITNLDECDDGVYEVICREESRDWETGYVDEWSYYLTPYTE